MDSHTDKPDASKEKTSKQEDFSAEKDFDDLGIPDPIKNLLNSPPLLPNESKDDFLRVYDDFFDPLTPETVPEHWLVWNSAILTWEVMRYHRMKISYLLNQRRAAVGSLIRKTFQVPSMRALRKAGSDIDDNIERYFSDPTYPPSVAQALEQAGFGADAAEAEAFGRSLSGLSQIERLISSAERRLVLFFREMERIHGNRAVRARNLANEALASQGE
jgi:hypothetical protein